MRRSTAIVTVLMPIAGVAIVVATAVLVKMPAAKTQPASVAVTNPASGQNDASTAGSTPVASTGPATQASEASAGSLDSDDKRRSDLRRIAAILQAYRGRTGAYPNTSGNVQTGCVYTDLDKLCQFRAQLGNQGLVDPRGMPTVFGYWYASDGRSFILYASLEGEPLPNETCAPKDPVPAKIPHLLCLHSGD